MPELAPSTDGYPTTFRADYQCMKCGHKVYGKHPVSLSRCMGCGKNSWRRYQRPEDGEVASVKPVIRRATPSGTS